MTAPLGNSEFCFCFGLVYLQIGLSGNIKHLMTGPEGNSEFCFPRISMFPEMKSRETLRFEWLSV